MLAWYRRYYLLVNVPLLLLITDLAAWRFDLIHHWPFNEKDDLSKAFTSYDARPPKPDDELMLLLGNSATDRGFDPETLEAALGKPHLRVFNFGLKAARVDDMFGLVEYLAQRGIKPKYAVIGINPYLLDDQVNSDTLYPWLERDTPYLYFHRSRIRTKLLVWGKYLVGLAKPKAAKADREVDPVPDATARIPKTALRAYVSEFANRGPDDYPLLPRIPELVDWLKQRGITPYVVILPMAEVGTHKAAEYPQLVQAVRKVVPPGSLDLSLQTYKFPDELFYDVGHPNKAGRVVFTRELGAWLANMQELER